MDDLAQLTNRVAALERAFERLYAGSGSAHTLGMYVSEFLTLPHLRGLWLPSSLVQGIAVYDVSGQGRTLTSSGATMLGLLYNGAVPYLDFTAANSDYMTRGDEAGLDITGAITLGCWVWFDLAGVPATTNRPVMTKERTTTYSPYQIFLEDAATQRMIARFSDSDAGTNRAEPITASAVSLSAWHCCIAKCTPGGTASLFVDGSFYTASAAALASLYNSTGAFDLGRGFGGAQFLDGRIGAVAFLCAAALTDARIDQLWRWGRGLFGV